MSPSPGLSPNAGTTGAPPGRRGCLWTSRTKTGMPRKGSWSCLFLPQIETLIRKRIRQLEAPAGPAILRREESEKDSIISASGTHVCCGGLSLDQTRSVRPALSLCDFTYDRYPGLPPVALDLPFGLKPCSLQSCCLPADTPCPPRLPEKGRASPVICLVSIP